MKRATRQFSAGALVRDPRFLPFESGNPIPWAFVAIILALIVWGALTIYRDAVVTPQGAARLQSAGEAAAPTAAGPDPAPSGAALFGQYCVSCHQPNGAGVRAAIPPLAGSRYVQASPEIPAAIVLRGMAQPIRVAGQTFQGRMPTFGGVLSDRQIAAILSFVRQSWSNGADPVTPELVAQVRATLAGDTLVPLAGGLEIEDLYGIPAVETEAPAASGGDGQ